MGLSVDVNRVDVNEVDVKAVDNGRVDEKTTFGDAAAMEEIDNTVADPWLRRRFADNVRRVRLEKKLSQEELSVRCGFHRTYISHVERAVRNVSLDNVQRIAEALGQAPETLLTVYCSECVVSSDIGSSGDA